MRHRLRATLSLLMTGQAAAGDWNADLRYRHEYVDDEAFGQDAHADTLRLRLGWSGELGRGFSAGAELEGVAELGDHFNSGANGRTAYPVVPDARALEINRRSEEHTSELQSRENLVCRLLLEKKKNKL